MHSTISVITGAKCAGKTHTAREILLMHPRGPALDVHGKEFWTTGAVWVADGVALKEALRVNRARDSWLITFTPDFDVAGASELLAWHAFQTGNCLAVFDEAHGYMTASGMGEQMGRLIRQARHRSVNLVLASPRLVDLSTGARFQADAWIVCGSLWTARDLETLEQHTSVEFRRQAQEPIERGEYRRLGFDTVTRQEFPVDRENLRKLFRVPKFEPRAPAAEEKVGKAWIERIFGRGNGTRLSAWSWRTWRVPVGKLPRRLPGQQAGNNMSGCTRV